MDSGEELLSELVELTSYKGDVKSHLELNKKLDSFFGLSSVKISSNNLDHYPNLDQDILNTSYSDFYQILKIIPTSEKLIDLGAGVGRGSLLSCLLGQKNCVSIEVSPERIKQLKNSLAGFDAECLAVCQDLEGSSIEDCAHYYLYFAKGRTLYYILRELFKKKTLLFVCEAHGDTLPFLDLFTSQLSVSGEIPLFIPRQYHSMRVYECSSANVGPQDKTINGHFPTWFINNFDTDSILLAKIRHKMLGEEVVILLPIKNFDLVTYESKIGLQHEASNRRYILEDEINIFSSINKKLPTSLVVELDVGSKVLCSQGDIYLERRDGNIYKTEYSTQSLEIESF